VKPVCWRFLILVFLSYIVLFAKRNSLNAAAMINPMKHLVSELSYKRSQVDVR
jgi:hypothetical protein